MRASDDRKWKEPSPREKREMIERGEWYEEEVPKKRAPLLFRMLAWVSLLAIFFALGYGATSVVFKWMDSRGEDKYPSNIVSSKEDINKLSEKSSTEKNTAADDSVVCTVSIPDGDSFAAREIRCRGGIREETIQQVLAAYIDAAKEVKLFEPSTQTLNFFQSGEWLYINMNKGFLASLNTLGPEKSKFVITALVKTISDNFAPINKIKFYIDGREIKDKKPVDLSMPWGIKNKSS